MKILTIEPIQQAQINDWKAKYTSGVFAVEVPSTDEAGSPAITGYFRKPTLDELGLATQGGGRENPLKVSRIIYNTCLLGGKT